jgi:hypothetical protein
VVRERTALLFLIVILAVAAVICALLGATEATVAGSLASGISGLLLKQHHRSAGTSQSRADLSESTD